MIKTFNNIVNSIKSYIKNINPYIDTSEGTILNDILINAPSQEIAKLYNEIDITSKSQVLSTASDSALDGLGENLGLVRKSARQAKGHITFFTFNTPTIDITIPAGTVVSTVPTSNNVSQRFITLSTVTLYKALSSFYLNTSTNAYEISVPIVAVNPGSDGNVGAQSITSFITPITGIDGLYNKEPTNGGSDIEDVEVWRARISKKWKGNNIGTINGLLSEVLSFSDDIVDAIVVGGNDVVRKDAGAVDVYIKGVRTTNYQEIFTMYDFYYGDLVFTKQPIISTAPISLILSNSGIINSSDYNIVKDTNEYGGSVRGQDKIIWKISPPSSSGSITANYSYNSLVSDLQNYLWRDDKIVQNVDVLVKWATEILINITITIKVFPGYDENIVISNIQTEIVAYLDSLNIGQELQQADVARIILNISGVDDLVLPFNIFESDDGTITPNAFGNLEIPFNKYVVANIINVNTFL